MRYYIFASGSKGNSTLILSNGKYLLIDNGLSERRFRSCLASVNVNFLDIDVVLITHSHSDHTLGLKMFEERCLYSTRSTTTLLDSSHELIPYRTYFLNGFKITVVPTSHDAVGSIGFIIEDENEKLVYITDTGYIYERVLNYIKDADYYIFESNHDVRMQLTSGRPQYLIDRIMGDYGHLSNEDAALYLSEVISPTKTKEIVLAHLSEEANTPEIALQSFYKIMSKRGVDVSNISVRCAHQKEMISGGDLVKEVVYG